MTSAPSDVGCAGAIVGRALYDGSFDLAAAIESLDRPPDRRSGGQSPPSTGRPRNVPVSDPSGPDATSASRRRT